MPDKNIQRISYKDLNDALKQAKEMEELITNTVYNKLEEDGIDKGRAIKFFKMTPIEEIEGSNDELLLEVLKVFGLNTKEKVEKFCSDQYYLEYLELHPETEVLDKQQLEENNKVGVDGYVSTEEIEKEFKEGYPANRFELVKKYLKDTWKEMDEITKSHEQVSEIEKEIHGLIETDVARKTSEEYAALLEKKLSDLKEKISIEKDEKEVKKLQAEIDEIENYKNFVFLYERTNRLGKEEIELIKDSFFDNRRSSYLMKKFKDKLKQLKYDPRVYMMFMNIEEKFLEKKYHVFNNLFLFHIVRYIAHVNCSKDSEKKCATNIIANLLNLSYNKFSSNTVRENFLNVIRTFLDQFEEYREFFNEENILHPDHPVRIAKVEKQNDAVKEMIYANLKDAGHEVTEEVKALDLDDLRKFYEEYLDQTLTEKQVKQDIALNDIIDKLHFNTESHERDKLKKIYMQYSEMTEKVNDKFNKLPIPELKELCHSVKEEALKSKSEDDSDTEE